MQSPRSFLGLKFIFHHFAERSEIYISAKLYEERLMTSLEVSRCHSPGSVVHGSCRTRRRRWCRTARSWPRRTRRRTRTSGTWSWACKPADTCQVTVRQSAPRRCPRIGNSLGRISNRERHFQSAKSVLVLFNLEILNHTMIIKIVTFFKGAQVGGRTWDLFDFRLFYLTIAAP